MDRILDSERLAQVGRLQDLGELPIIGETLRDNDVPQRVEEWIEEVGPYFTITEAHFEVVRSVRACRFRASATAAWAWPRTLTAMPATRSRYLLPASSQIQQPSPRTRVSGWRA